MSKEGKFIVYCIEIFKTANNLTGKETIELFKNHGIMDYLQKYYEALHTTGERYIINDIQGLIAADSTTS